MGDTTLLLCLKNIKIRMKKIGIEIDEKNQFLYAFCCATKDYKLVWHLNNNMSYKYRKDKDIPFYSEKLNKKIYFTQYKDKDNNNDNQVTQPTINSTRTTRSTTFNSPSLFTSPTTN